MRSLFFIAAVTVGALSGAETLTKRVPRFSGLVNETELARVQSITAPMISSEGDITVTARDASRAPLRWPVLRFAATTMANFEEAFYAIGSRESPLSIELGSETNAVTSVRRDRIQTADGFSQLIIRVPNPHTVDLDTLRTAILEASLREEARKRAGAYSALKWPRWFLQGAADATQGPLLLVEAYERLQTEIAERGYPQLTACFDPAAEPSRETATFFARWILERARARTLEAPDAFPTPQEALVTAPWTAGAFLDGAVQADWEAWLRDLDNRVFLPGVLTRSQFQRWRREIRRDLTPEAAQAQRLRLVREMVGRPKPFAELSLLYIKATDALAAGNAFAAMELFTEADSAADFLSEHFNGTGYLVGEGVPQSAHVPAL